jgi:hypothetical protein
VMVKRLHGVELQRDAAWMPHAETLEVPA